MSDHPNVQVVRELLEAFNNQDREAIDQHMADDVVWHTIGGRTATGLKELELFITESDLGPKVSIEIHDIVGNEDHVIALVEATAETDSEKFTYKTAEIVHVDDGRVTERWAFSDDTGRISQFFSQFE